MVAATVILLTTFAHGTWAQSPPAPPPRDVPGAPTTAPPDRSPSQAHDPRDRDGGPGSVALPRIRPTAVHGIRNGSAPAPEDVPAEEPEVTEAAGEPATNAAPPAPPAPRPVAAVPESTQAAPAPAAVAAPAVAPAIAWRMPIAPDWPTLALLTMVVPAGAAAAWALSGLARRPGEG